MCTLTYLINSYGYQLFFNRDEQRSRPIAIAPVYDPQYHAIFPIDPLGQGTWLAVHEQGYSLALLNNYQAAEHLSVPNKISRGQIILALLESSLAPQDAILQLDLQRYSPFQLVIFPAGLSRAFPVVLQFKYDGKQLTQSMPTLPITSSSIDITLVLTKRQDKYQQVVGTQPSLASLKQYHYSTEALTHQSVNMSRADASTVSISHIDVSSKIVFNYHDLHTDKTASVQCDRISNTPQNIDYHFNAQY